MFRNAQQILIFYMLSSVSAIGHNSCLKCKTALNWSWLRNTLHGCLATTRHFVFLSMTELGTWTEIGKSCSSRQQQTVADSGHLWVSVGSRHHQVPVSSTRHHQAVGSRHHWASLPGTTGQQQKAPLDVIGHHLQGIPSGHLAPPDNMRLQTACTSAPGTTGHQIDS